MAGKLPTVTQYIKNVGKSFGYAAVDVIKEPTENVSDFMETNEELFKTVYSSVKNYRRTLRYIDRSFKKSRVYDAVSTGWKNVKDDLKTGNWYNKEREMQVGSAALFGDDFMDFSMFEDVDLEGGGSDDLESIADDNSNGSATAKAAAMQSKASLTGSSMVMDAITQNSHMEANIIASTGEVLGQTIQAGTRIQMMQSEKIYSGVMQGFSGANAGIKLISEVLNGPLNSFMNESTKFYGEMNKNISEINAYLKEMTEMQRNLYKVQQKEYKDSAYEQVVGASGAPDIMQYMKKIYKNVQDLDPTGFLADKDSNMLKAFAGAPLKMIPELMVKTLLPDVMRNTMKTFDESLTGVFTAFITKMNDWADNSVAGENGINLRGIIGRILGIKIDKKTGLDTTKYNKGPIPFDGETKKAIVDIIPAYLSRIESALTGQPERVFDPSVGKFRTARQIDKQYREIFERAAASTTSDLDDTFDKWARRHIQRTMPNKSEDDQGRALESMKKEWKKFGKAMLENPNFNPYATYGPRGERSNDIENPYDKYFGGPENWKDFMKFAKTHNRKALYNLSRNSVESRLGLNRLIEGNDGVIGNAYNILFDDRFLGLDNKGKLKVYNPNKSEKLAPNIKFKNTNDYLKDILAEVRYIRINGVRGVGKGKGKGKVPPSQTFEQFYKNQGFEGTDIESPYEDENKKYSFSRYDEKKEKSELEKYGITPDVAKQFAEAKGFTERFEVTKKAVANMLRRPAAVFAGFINKADERLFDIMFGREDGTTFRDRAGLEYQGFLDYLVIKTGEVFDQFKDKMKTGWNWMIEQIRKTRLGSAAIDKFNEIRGSVGDALKSKFSFLRNRGSEALSNTYGAAYNKVAASDTKMGSLFRALKQGVVSAEEAGQIVNQDTTLEDEQEAWFERNFGNMARGGRVNKYGLTMVSPGEIIIPNAKYMQNKNLAKENREKSKFRNIFSNIGNMARGNVNTESVIIDEQRIAEAQRSLNQKKQEETLIKKVLHETAGKDGDIIADAIIGSGVSLLTGMIGGPLLGAVFGTGVGLIKNSSSLQKILFGEFANGEQTKEGIIPKKVQDFFKKHSQGMIDFGVAGAVAGLFTPLGLVGGAMAGAALGYAKDTKVFKDFMFGNAEEGKDGLMSEETRNKLKKAIPNMAIGGAALGLLGPFGLIGGSLLGATAGYVTSTDKFKEFLFGFEGPDGKKQGGVAGAIKDGFVRPLKEFGKDIVGKGRDYLKKNFLNPLTDFLKGSSMFLRDTIGSIAARVSDGINGIFERHIGMPVDEFLREKVFKRATRLITGIAKVMLKPAGAIASAPFRLAGAVGNRLTARSIRRGTAVGMSAAQRLQWRKEHNIGSGDSSYLFDNMLNEMNVDQLSQMGSAISKFNSGTGTLNKMYRQSVSSAGSIISNYFDSNNIWNRDKSKAYNAKKFIIQSIQNGKDARTLSYQVLNKFPTVFNSPEEVKALIDKLPLEEIYNNRKGAIKEAGLTDEAVKMLERSTGMHNLSKKNSFHAKELGRYVNAELKSKKKIESSMSPEQRAQLEGNTAERHIETLVQKILNHLTGYNEEHDNLIEDTKAKATEIKKFNTLPILRNGVFYNIKGTRLSDNLQEYYRSKYANSIIDEVTGTTLSGEVEGTTHFNARNSAFRFGKKIGSFAANRIGGLGAIASNFRNSFTLGSDSAYGNNSARYEGLNADTVRGLSTGNYHFQDNDDGSQTIVDRNGNPAPGSPNADKYKRYMEKHKDEVKGRQTFFGAISAWVGDKVGRAGGFVKRIKDKIKQTKQAIENIPVVGKIIKGVKAVGILAIVASLIGHASGFIINIKDWLKDKLGGVISKVWQGEDGNGGIKGFFSNLWTNIQTKFPQYFGEESVIGKFIANIKGKIDDIKKNGLKGTVANIIKGAWDFLVDGWKKSYENIISPVWNWLYPRLAQFYFNLKDSTSIANFMEKAETTVNTMNGYSVSTRTYTSDSGSPTIKTVNGQSVHAELSHTVKLGGNTFIYEKYKNNTIVVKCEETQEYVRFDNGPNITDNTKISYGILVTKDGKPANGTIISGGIAGGAIGGIAGVIGGSAAAGAITGATAGGSFAGIGAAAGSVVPGIGTVIGLGVGTLIGIGVTVYCYYSKEKGYVNEGSFTYSQNVQLAEEILMSFGFDVNNNYAWPSETSNLGTDFGWEGKTTSSSTGAVKHSTRTTGRDGTRTVSSDTSHGRGRRGFGRQGGIYANMPYGNSTIGESGCGPIAAVAAMRGRGIPDAAAYAEGRGYVYPDGSTDIGYFGDYFASKGISSRTTTNKQEVMNAIRNGQNAVLLGRDHAGGVYSGNDHYITAMGGQGRLAVYDPELGPRTVSTNAAMSGMKAAVITGRGRGRYRGRGTSDLNISKIINKAKQQLGNDGTIYQNAYGLKDKWCCMFIWWLFDRLNASNLFYGGNKCASCGELYNYYSKTGQIVQGDANNIKAGDLVFFNTSGSKISHIGLAIEDAKNGNVTTIDGNTGRPSGKTGPSYGVYQKTRSRSYVVAAARPAYGDANMSDLGGASVFTDGGTSNTDDPGDSSNLFSAFANLGKSILKALFGNNLYNALFGNGTSSSSGGTPSGSYSEYTATESADEIFKYLTRTEGFSAAQAAGIMGNWEQESGNRADRLEGDYVYAKAYGGVNEILKSRDMLDKYVLNTLFPGYQKSGISINKSAYLSNGHYYPGLGLAQWTGPRGERLFNYASGKNADWRDLITQLGFFSQEMDQRGGRDAVKKANTPEDAAYNFFDTFEMPGKGKSTNSTIVKTLANRKSSARSIFEKYKNTSTSPNGYVSTASLRGTSRSDFANKALSGGYSRKVNTNYTNSYSGSARVSTDTATGSLSYDVFLETIITILTSISTNTGALSKILEILSTKFGINIDTAEVDKAVKLSEKEARQALNSLMQSKNNQQTIGNILQGKDTGYVISAMQELARM